MMILIFLLCTFFTVYPAYSNDFAKFNTAKTVDSKIEQSLLSKIKNIESQSVLENSTITYIIYLNEQADLSKVEGNPQAVIELLKSVAKNSQEKLIEYLENEKKIGNVIDYKSLWIQNMLIVTSTTNVVYRLAQHNDIRLITDDKKIRLYQLPITDYQLPITNYTSSSAQWNISKIKADSVWILYNNRGDDIVVAGLDTGVDGTHPALSSQYRGGNNSWRDFTSQGYTTPKDGHGHGTHTMGTICGSNGIGVAPNAKWIAGKVFKDNGDSYDSWIHQAFQWIMDPDGNPSTRDEPAIVNNSWGDDITTDLTFYYDIKALLSANILLVFAIGNNGNSCVTPGTANTPGNLPDVLGVGAIASDDKIAYFSAMGPAPSQAPWNGVIKPDVCAPGQGIYSSIPGGNYGYMQGTSMASPHIAGVSALIKKAKPELTPPEIKNIIEQTAIDLGIQGKDNCYGSGRVNALLSVELALYGWATINGIIKDANTLSPLSDINISVSNGETIVATAKTNQDGFYSTGYIGGTYTMHIEGFYHSPKDTQITVNSGYNTINIVLQQLPSGSLEGYVKDTNNNPISQAVVNIINTPIKPETTDVNGRYYINLIPTGYYQIKVRAINKSQIITNLNISTGTNVLNISLANAPPVLLVDDDKGSQYEGYYTSSLDVLVGVSGYSYYNVAENGSPEYIDIAGRQAIIWFTGIPGGAPDANSRKAISSYLNNGGNLFITGQDIGWTLANSEAGEDKAFYTNYLHSIYLTDAGSSKTGLVGVAGDEIGNGLSFDIQGGDGANNQEYPSTISPISPAVSIIKDANSNTVAIKCNTGIYKVVYFAFGYEGISNIEKRDIVMQRVLNWFGIPTSVDAIRNPQFAIRNQLVLLQNYPNPFNPETVISYQIADDGGQMTGGESLVPRHSSLVTLKIYSINGQLVRTLVNDKQEAGYYKVVWNGKDDNNKEVSSGIYIYRLTVDNNIIATKYMVMVK